MLLKVCTKKIRPAPKENGSGLPDKDVASSSRASRDFTASTNVSNSSAFTRYLLLTSRQFSTTVLPICDLIHSTAKTPFLLRPRQKTLITHFRPSRGRRAAAQAKEQSALVFQRVTGALDTSRRGRNVNFVEPVKDFSTGCRYSIQYRSVLPRQREGPVGQQ